MQIIRFWAWSAPDSIDRIGIGDRLAVLLLQYVQGSPLRRWA